MNCGLLFSRHRYLFCNLSRAHTEIQPSNNAKQAVEAGDPSLQPRWLGNYASRDLPFYLPLFSSPLTLLPFPRVFSFWILFCLGLFDFFFNYVEVTVGAGLGRVRRWPWSWDSVSRHWALQISLFFLSLLFTPQCLEGASVSLEALGLQPFSQTMGGRPSARWYVSSSQFSPGQFDHWSSKEWPIDCGTFWFSFFNFLKPRMISPASFSPSSQMEFKATSQAAFGTFSLRVESFNDRSPMFRNGENELCQW